MVEEKGPPPPKGLLPKKGEKKSESTRSPQTGRYKRSNERKLEEKGGKQANAGNSRTRSGYRGSTGVSFS